MSNQSLLTLSQLVIIDFYIYIDKLGILFSFFKIYFQSMATANTTTKCSTCEKETRTYICEGCSQKFCRTDLTKHFQLLDEQLNQTITDYDGFRQKLLHRKDSAETNPLIEEN